MNIEVGKWYQNKTWRFLLPCLRGHGGTFVKKLSPVFKLAVGIHDTLLDGSDMAQGRNLLIMCDKKYQERMFHDFITWLRYEPYYKTDYCPDGDFKKSRKHVVVVEIPEIFANAYDHFLKGEYSKMYTKEQVNYLFSSDTRKQEYAILTKSRAEIPNFTKKLNDTFGTDLKVSDYEGGELELPLERCQEIFNCEPNQRVYFNEELDVNFKN